MKERDWKKRWGILSFVIISGFILFFNLWGRSLENHGYLRYAEVAREMIRSGEWVVPCLNGQVYIDKPPLLFWLIAIPSSLYGYVTPFLAKLPSALSAWIGVVLLFLWGRRTYGTERSGFIAGGVLLSTYQYFHQARVAKTDILLCLFIVLSLYLFYVAYVEAGKRRCLLYGLSFFSMGLGVLTKGPLGLVPLLIIGVFLLKERRWQLLFSGEFIVGYGILMLMVLPWILLFLDRVGFGKSVTVVKEAHVLTRHAPVYFYFIQIWGQFFPWSVLFPFLFFYLWKQRTIFWNSKESFFIIWFLVVFIVITLFKYRTSRYLLPALPPVALMMGGAWRKRMLYFFIPFILIVFLWHAREYHWVQKDLSYSPGMVLTSQLRPFTKDTLLFGYRLDKATIEEVNFYLERVIPILTDLENLSGSAHSEAEKLILMPKEIHEEIRIQGSLRMSFVQEFKYKRGKLVLVSTAKEAF